MFYLSLIILLNRVDVLVKLVRTLGVLSQAGVAASFVFQVALFIEALIFILNLAETA